MRWAATTSGLILATASALSGCSRDPAPAPAPAATSAAPAASSAAPPPAPTLEGRWQGSYEVERHTIELPPEKGGVEAWQQDDGKTAVGKGTIELTIDAAGLAHATAKGPLGALQGRGLIRDDRLTLRLDPAAGARPAFGGTLQATRDGDRMEGELRVSSSDSSIVRRGKVTIDKQGAQ